ncbi:chaperone modulator CbpM [Bordetella holmesii]|uniref:MerR HTH family regulatory protein n=2 Tax=Bordetella holmesii TaxID=35814 RepID=A0A158M1M3_9BORD|nr:chaperone modulator CbpM [Bordetella holmesii]AIT27678.1 merR HTH regulatory family protein [Bordetella holmesii 44057]AMD46474.1 MerR family transcriptional regulator [Bordetella holmesii H558]AMD48136.1 MerR family transcripitonal regulator [Bordetella holmesii F627]AOB35370.1 MerR family transcriptional regulator [Bordetella holmesii]AUL19350.1 MerR family transcriptional regulator [Bordetella holmesii]
MKSVTITHTTVICPTDPLTAEELARACQAEIDWVVRLVEVGIVAAHGSHPAAWRFESADLSRALGARRLERDFGAGLDAAALILDMEQEIRRLKGQMRALGLSR